MSKHQKHANIARPQQGNFHRNEWAVLGTTCGAIKQLSFQLIKALQPDFRTGYVDADHPGHDTEQQSGRDTGSAMAFGAHAEYTDKISYHRLDWEGPLEKFQFRQYFNNCDGVLVNGNHFEAAQQIVVIDPKKEKSLQKRLKQLTNVQLILFTEAGQSVYPWLSEALPQLAGIPQLQLSDTTALLDFLRKQLQKNKAPLYGLVLAGGRSQRMGKDKGMIDYHGKPQRYHMADQLSTLCAQTFISCRADQVEEIAAPYQPLPDTFTGLGPFGALLSAFRAQPDAAWLVVACDLPLLDVPALQELITARNPSKTATAFYSPVTDFPEPLIAIWEPRAYPEALQFLAQGYACPRKVLINTEIELLQAKQTDVLLNVNRPEEQEAVNRRLQAE